MADERSLLYCLASHQNDVDAYYASVHEQAGETRIFWDDALHAWVVTGYEECTHLLRDPRLVRARLTLPRESQASDLVEFAQRVLDAQTMFSDDPSVPSRRMYWSQVLAEGVDTTLEQSLPMLAAAVLDVAPVGADIDAYADIFQPYISRAVCVRLGINERERCQIYPYIVRYVRFLDGKIGRHEDLQAALLSIATLYARLGAKWEAFGTANPDDRHRWISDYLLALVAGHDSTAYLLGTVLLNAGGAPDALAAAAADPRQLGRLVSEALRYDSPVQLVGRRIAEDVLVNGHAMKAGERVFLHIGAANRDSRVFGIPAAFDPNRSGPAPLAFGWGDSQCIGRSLAVRAAVVFLATLADHACSIEIDRNRVTWNSGLAGRGFRALPGRLRAPRNPGNMNGTGLAGTEGNA